MKLLGIDPGTRFAGFAIAKSERGTTFLLDHGYLKLKPTAPLNQRVAVFHDFFAQKIAEWGIQALALETPFLGKNAQNFLKLGYLRGILYLLSAKHELELLEFSPRQVKGAVTGFGGASKEQVANVILKLFPRIKKPERDDVTDALAVTLCGLWQAQKSRRHPALVGRAGSISRF